MNIENTLNNAVKILNKFKIKNSILDSEILLSKVINRDRKYIFLNSKENLNQKYLKNFNNLIVRRKRGEPVAYLTNKKEFWKHSFYVDQNVLIPRPDTEIIVEEVLNELKNNDSKKILDIGTGSGCIIISILKERKKCTGTGIDIEKKAIKLAKYNAKIQHIKNRIRFLNSDIDNFYLHKYDLIISNPPYVKLHEINSLDKDIKNFEPKVALNGGIDGYTKIRLIIKKSSNLIKKKGKFFLEVGFGQTREALKLLKLNGFYTNRVVKDLANINRCIISTKI